MANIGYLLGDSAFDATIKSIKTGHGLGPIGSIGMGLGKMVGSAALGTASLTGKAAMGGASAIGRGLLSSIESNPFAVAGAAITGATVAHFAGDADGQQDTHHAVMKGAMLGFGASALGGAGLVSGLGIATAGAAMTGVNAFGAVGSSFLRAKTKGEKYSELSKDFASKSKGLSGKELEGAREKFTKEVSSFGAKAGSAEEMEIGIGNLNDFKLRKGIAVPMIVGSSLIKGIAGGVQAFERSRMGVNDGMMRTATPMMPTPDQTMVTSPGNPIHNSNSYYANNAGATGDLVFALHKNR